MILQTIKNNRFRVFPRAIPHFSVLAAIVILPIVIFTSLSIRIYAAATRIYFSAPPEVTVGTEFSVTVYIDSGAALNAYSFEVSYPQNVEPTTFDWRGSIADLRPDQPRSTGSGGVLVEGAGLTPFSGNGGKIITLNFRALKEGAAEFDFSKADVFAADGTGKSILPDMASATVQILGESELGPTAEEEAGGEPIPISADKTPPEIREISLSRDPFYPDQKIFGFIVTDDGSGVRSVEGRVKHLIFWGEWVPVRSPMAVSDGAWAVALRVTDGGGNVAERVLYDWSAFAVNIAPFAAAFAAFAAFSIVIVRRRK